MLVCESGGRPVKKSVMRCCVVCDLALVVAVFSMVAVDSGVRAGWVRGVCWIYRVSICWDLPSLTYCARESRTRRSHLLRIDGLLWSSLVSGILQ